MPQIRLQYTGKRSGREQFDSFFNRWPRLYKGVYRCNKLIEAIDQISFKSETTKKQVLGEAHFMRGMYYFDLTRMYGDVPLYPTSDVSNIPRTSAAEVFALIGSDMKKAIELLPATSLSYSHSDFLHTTFPEKNPAHRHQTSHQKRNLYTFTGYYGMEPEIGFGMNYWAKGIDVGMYPTPRTLLFGANIKF